MTISTCCACWLPSQTTSTRLADERADDRADRVGGVDAADQPRRDPGRARRPTRAPAGSSRPRESRRAARPRGSARGRAGTLNHGVGRDRRIDRPVRQRLRQHVRRPRDRAAQQHLAPAERDARTLDARARSPSRCCCRCRGRRGTPQNQREGVDGRAEEQRQQARPDTSRRRAPSCPRARSRRRPRARPAPLDRPRRRVGDRLVRRRAARAAAPSAATSDVQRHRHVGRDRHVVHAQQVEARRAGCRSRRRRCCRRRRSRATTRPSASSRPSAPSPAASRPSAASAAAGRCSRRRARKTMPRTRAAHAV